MKHNTTSVYSGQATAVPEPTLPQVLLWDKNLEAATKALATAVEVLLSKLSAVSTQAGVGGEPDQAPRQALVPLAERLRDHHNSIMASVAHLEYAARRVEL